MLSSGATSNWCISQDSALILTGSKQPDPRHCYQTEGHLIHHAVPNHNERNSKLRWHCALHAHW